MTLPLGHIWAFFFFFFHHDKRLYKDFIIIFDIDFIGYKLSGSHLFLGWLNV